MKTGYPCLNYSVGCQAAKTFRLKSFSESRFYQTVENNLMCLLKILEFNSRNRLLFFRITSDLIPFASHPVNQLDWQSQFKDSFETIGDFINENNIRISMHPDQFTLINSPREDVHQNSIKELEYHTNVLDLLKLDNTAKIQIHVGGVYNDKNRSIERFIKRYIALPERIKKRLVIENDDKSYSVKDCLIINKQVGIPVLFDVFHHILLNNGESIHQAMEAVSQTWTENDGQPMVDYSSQKPDARPGTHTESIDLKDFDRFFYNVRSLDFDVMLEIKDKERSALQLREHLKNESKFLSGINS